MKLKPINTEKDYQKAMVRLAILFDAKKGTAEGEELEILAILIDKYETEKFPINLPDPISAISFRMEQMGLKQKDLEPMIGFKSRVSEIMNKKRKLTLSMIRNLSTNLKIPAEVLVQDY
jgi:HTH-type transcriptional regulator/antitoxin HigA